MSIVEETPLNYIYLIHTREFVNAKKPIYKVGKSCQPNLKRVKTYPNGSQLLIQILCNDCTIMERTIIQLFTSKYIRHTELGNEYFEGDYKAMICLYKFF
jgi:hypothetical protein